jgi:hypothetical protein
MGLIFGKARYLEKMCGVEYLSWAHRTSLAHWGIRGLCGENFKGVVFAMMIDFSLFSQ